MSQWLELEQAGHTGKTVIVRVLSKSTRALLGTIRWYGAWRQYAFFPIASTVFNGGCLAEIEEHMRDLMAQRKGEQL